MPKPPCLPGLDTLKLFTISKNEKSHERTKICDDCGNKDRIARKMEKRSWH